MEYACEWGYISENPARKVKPGKAKKKIFCNLSFDEIERLLEYYPLYATAAPLEVTRYTKGS